MEMRQHVFVSPHLDDAALSCGGYIHRLSLAGHSVTVATVVTADAPDGTISWVARRNILSWRSGPAPFAVRRKEDEAAVRALGARHVHLGFLDAMYRGDDAGRPLYTSRIVGVPVHTHDWERQEPAVRESLRELLASYGPDMFSVYCPLGTSRHVDHLIVRKAVEGIKDRCDIVYYEDQPYAALGRGVPATAVLDDGDGEWFSIPLSLSEAEIEARVEAISHYESQLGGLFPSARERVLEIARARLPFFTSRLGHKPDLALLRARMAASLDAYAEQVGGERYWFRCAERVPALLSFRGPERRS